MSFLCVLKGNAELIRKSNYCHSAFSIFSILSIICACVDLFIYLCGSARSFNFSHFHISFNKNVTCHYPNDGNKDIACDYLTWTFRSSDLQLQPMCSIVIFDHSKWELSLLTLRKE